MTKLAIKDACNAYKRFFKGYSNFPRFKSRKHSTPSFYQDNVKIQFTKTHVKVEGFATPAASLLGLILCVSYVIYYRKKAQI